MPWVVRLDPPHACQQPSLSPEWVVVDPEGRPFSPPRIANASPHAGSLWECGECGRLWEVRFESFPSWPGQGKHWRRASWWTRRRLRKERER
jgi:hypothetical protein